MFLHDVPRIMQKARTTVRVILTLSLLNNRMLKSFVHRIDEEIKMSNKMTVAIRRKRLEQKLKAEILQYEVELNARGLAVSKSRD